MLSVEEALKLVLDHVRPCRPQPLTVGDAWSSEALGCVLTETVTSDIDSPPHDKSIVDGYAIIAADATKPGVELAVIEEVTAGAVPTRTVERGTATRIMTGAPIPPGADSVVMVEQTTLDGDRVQIQQSPVKSGQNIGRRGASLRRGQTVLKPGTVLRPIEIGLLAEVGRSSVEGIRRPLVAVIPTGNELVRPHETPGPGQIRNSNGPMLRALAESAGGRAREFPIAPDDRDQLGLFIGMALGSRIILLSGGVSAGVLDLVPGVLRDWGVQEVFHKVNLKPGKPLWFGVKDEPQIQSQTLVFGLPGNPVSGLVCFELFVRPAIEKLSGREPKGLPRVTATLTKEHKQRGDRPAYWPARLSDGMHLGGTPPQAIEFPSLVGLGVVAHELQTPLHSIIGFAEVLQNVEALGPKEKRYVENILKSGRLLKEILDDIHPSNEGWSHLVEVVRSGQANYGSPVVTPLPWQGSGDLRTLTDANCLALFPGGDRVFQPGEILTVLLMD